MSGYLSERELEIFTLAAFNEWRYDNSNPEVGMPPGTHEIVRRVADKLTFKLCEIDLDVAATWLGQAIREHQKR